MNSKSRIALVVGAICAVTLPAAGQSPRDGLASDAEHDFKLTATGDFNDPTFQFWRVSPAEPDANGIAGVEADVVIIFRPPPTSDDAEPAAMRIDRRMSCGGEVASFAVQAVTTYRADGTVLSQGDRIPAALSGFAAEGDYRLKMAAHDCQPAHYPIVPVRFIRPPAPRERPIGPAPSVPPQPAVTDVPSMLAWARRREADYEMARSWPLAGRFVVAADGPSPVIVDFDSRTEMGDETQLTVIGFAGKDKDWALRVTGRVDCEKQTVVPEYQADYNGAGQLQAFLRLGEYLYAMPGVDSYGAMFAPACTVMTPPSDQAVYTTLSEAVAAVRKGADNAGD